MLIDGIEIQPIKSPAGFMLCAASPIILECVAGAGAGACGGRRAAAAAAVSL